MKKENALNLAIGITVFVLLTAVICTSVFAGIMGTVGRTNVWQVYRPFDNDKDKEFLLNKGKELKPGDCWVFQKHMVCKIPKGVTFSQLCADFYNSSDKQTVMSVWKQAFANRVLDNPGKIFEGEVFILPKSLLMD